jgi:hypothetical protein
MNTRFEAVDKRFESVQKETNSRFDSLQREMDKRFDAVDKRFNQLTWLIGLMFVSLSVIMTVFKFVK